MAVFDAGGELSRDVGLCKRRCRQDQQFRTLHGLGQVAGGERKFHLAAALEILERQASRSEHRRKCGCVAPPETNLVPLFSEVGRCCVAAVAPSEYRNPHSPIL